MKLIKGKHTAKKLQLPMTTDDISKPSTPWRYPPKSGPMNALNTPQNTNQRA